MNEFKKNNQPGLLGRFFFGLKWLVGIEGNQAPVTLRSDDELRTPYRKVDEVVSKKQDIAFLDSEDVLDVEPESQTEADLNLRRHLKNEVEVMTAAMQEQDDVAGTVAFTEKDLVTDLSVETSDDIPSEDLSMSSFNVAGTKTFTEDDNVATELNVPASDENLVIELHKINDDEHHPEQQTIYHVPSDELLSKSNALVDDVIFVDEDGNKAVLLSALEEVNISDETRKTLIDSTLVSVGAPTASSAAPEFDNVAVVKPADLTIPDDVKARLARSADDPRQCLAIPLVKR